MEGIENKQQAIVSSDCISRKAAIKSMANAIWHYPNELYTSLNSYEMSEALAKDGLMFLPSAQPEPCEDAVSRHRLLSDLKELIVAWEKYPVMAEQIKGVKTAIGYVKTIPSVTPKGELMTNADKFKQIFGLYATELWSKTEVEFLAWLNSDFSQSDVPDMNVGDMVSRQAAIDAVHKNYDSILDFKSDGHTVADSFEDIINVLPSAQPELCEDAISRSEAIKVIEAIPDGNWKSIRYSKEIQRLPSVEPEPERKKGDVAYER